MGRAAKSQGLAPPAIRKDLRAKQARQIVNKVIPAILASNSRARKGSENSEIIVNPDTEAPTKVGENSQDTAYVKRKGQGKRKAKFSHDKDVPVSRSAGLEKEELDRKERKSDRSMLQDTTATASLPPRAGLKIRIAVTDTLTAACMLRDPTVSKKSSNVCILNMASPLRPGGGVLTGATSQEEFLCARTTLLPSLKEEYYRLPEVGGIWTPDVQVFRNASSLGDSAGELGTADRYWVDVISAGMLRFPELEGEEDEVKTLGRRDRQMVETKMRAVLRIAARKKVKSLVLGAWGCGAYGNPVPDIAQAWKKVLEKETAAAGTKGKKDVAADTWPALEDVMFAITNRKMAADFAEAFGGEISVEHISPSDDLEEDEDEEDKVGQELRTKIEEIEGQISQVWSPHLQSGLTTILQGLKAQLAEREAHGQSDSEGGVDV